MFLCWLFEKIEDTKSHSEINWPLGCAFFLQKGLLHCQLASFLVHLLCKEGGCEDLSWILGTHVSLIQFQFNSYLIKIKVAREELWFMTTPYFCNRYLSPAPPAMQCKKAIARGICTPWQEWGRQMGHLLHLQKITFQFFGTLAEFFYYVNYYVKSWSNNLSNENIQIGVSREMLFQK